MEDSQRKTKFHEELKRLMDELVFLVYRATKSFPTKEVSFYLMKLVKCFGEFFAGCRAYNSNLVTCNLYLISRLQATRYRLHVTSYTLQVYCS